MHFLITISATTDEGEEDPRARHCTGPYFDDDPWAVAVFCKDTCIPVEGPSVRLLLLLVVCYTQKLILIDGTCIIRSVSVLVSLLCSCEVSYVGGEWWTTILSSQELYAFPIQSQMMMTRFTSRTLLLVTIFSFIFSRKYKSCALPQPFLLGHSNQQMDSEKKRQNKTPVPSPAHHQLGIHCCCSSTSWLKPQFVFIIRTLALSYFLSVRWKANTIFGRWWNVFTGRNIC